MYIREITVSVGRTVNLGNFESLRCDVSATATIAEGDEADADETPGGRHRDRSARVRPERDRRVDEGWP